MRPWQRRASSNGRGCSIGRNEVGAMLVAAGLAGARDHALLSLLALNGLRISEALGASIERLGLERVHRTLTILRKGGKVVTIPLAPRTARGSISPSVNAAKDRSSSHTMASDSTDMRPVGSCAASHAEPGSTSASDHTPCDTRSSPPPSTPAFHCETCKKPPATPILARPGATTAPASPSTDTPPTS